MSSAPLPASLTPWQEERLSLCVGRLLSTGILPNTCIGDDMGRKGSSSFRAGALQSNGEGGTPTHLVENWVRAVKDLHLDIFCISETRISYANKHRLIEDIFRRKGFAVISHNRSTTLPEGDPGCNSSGIILGISRDIPGGLSNIRRDTNGRAIAASIPYSDASTIRVVAIYGPTAAMTRRFPHTPHGPREERDWWPS